MGFWRTLGGGALGFLTGGPAGAVIGGLQGAQADIAANAEKKGAQQQMDALNKGIEAYSPIHTLGVQADQKLAEYLGLPGLPAGMPTATMAPTGPTMNPNGFTARVGRMFDGVPQQDQTLASLLVRHPPEEAPTVGTARALPSGSARGRSSYRAMEMN